MTAKQTVFLTEDRKTAVPQGDKRAKFKLVHAGQEISEGEANKYEGALALIQGEATKQAPKPEPGEIQTRDPQTENRDPKLGKRDR